MLLVTYMEWQEPCDGVFDIPEWCLHVHMNAELAHIVLDVLSLLLLHKLLLRCKLGEGVLRLPAWLSWPAGHAGELLTIQVAVAAVVSSRLCPAAENAGHYEGAVWVTFDSGVT